MYTIPLKDNSKEIDLMLLRSLLALSGITAFFYRTPEHAIINITISLLLLLFAFAVNYLRFTVGIKKIYLLLVAGALLFGATHAPTFSVILICFGMLSSFLYKKPLVLLEQEGITLISSKGNKFCNWDEFDNVVLKDKLLTLDYKNNKLQQLEVDDSSKFLPDESVVNYFCKSCLLA